MTKLKTLFVATVAVGTLTMMYAYTKINPSNLFYKNLETGTCISAGATTVNTGVRVLPPVGYQGFYSSSQCNTILVVGYRPDSQ